MIARAVLVGLVALAAQMKPEAWWTGLDVQASAPARGVRALETPPMARVRVPGGKFAMGSTRHDVEVAASMCLREVLGTPRLCELLMRSLTTEQPAHIVTVSAFEIDRTEVPVSAYARCVAAGACSPPGFAPGDAQFDRPNFPVTHVRWDDAAVYCSWVHGRLPTEAEWELAARGGGSRFYPWGNVYNGRVCNHGALAPDDTDASDSFLGLAPVDAFKDGATPEGILNLSGNAAEWVADWFSRDDQGYGYATRPETNPKGAPNNSGMGHSVRGGSYRDAAPGMRAAARAWNTTSARDIGFRCAYDPT